MRSKACPERTESLWRIHAKRLGWRYPPGLFWGESSSPQAHRGARGVRLVELRLLLVDRLRAELASWDVQPAAAALFGSAARGDGGTDSDIDLFVVRSAAVEVDDPVWLAQSDALATGVRAWTGNNASIVESSVEELVDLIGRAPPILDSIRADAIDLSGPPIRSLLRSAR